MQCPRCKKEIEMEKAYLCPHCYYVFDECFRQASLPQTDFQDRKVTEIYIDPQNVLGAVRASSDLFDTYVEMTPTPTKLQNMIASVPVLLSVIFSLALGFLLNFFVGIIVFIMLIIASTTWMTIYVHNLLKPRKVSVSSVPIRYYENEHVFGCVKIEIQDNKLAQPPKYSFWEIDKSSVIAVRYNYNKSAYVLHLDQALNAQDIVYIPDVFEKGKINQIFNK